MPTSGSRGICDEPFGCVREHTTDRLFPQRLTPGLALVAASLGDYLGGRAAEVFGYTLTRARVLDFLVIMRAINIMTPLTMAGMLIALPGGERW